MNRFGEREKNIRKTNISRPYFQENRFKKTNFKKQEFDISKENFPQMTNEIKEEKVEKLVKDFKNLDFNNEVIVEERKKIKKGWLLLNKENLDKYKFEKMREKEWEETFVVKRVFQNMINNWQIYRNGINDLLGDRSPYIFTEQLVDQMVSEEYKIHKEIEEYNEDKRMGRLEKEEDIIFEEIYN